MELAGTMNLKEFIDKRNTSGKPLTKPEIIYIFKQVLGALNYLHRNNIVHLDIKAENVCINEKNLTVKLVDFGFAASGKENVRNMDIYCGTPQYMAPEFFLKKIYDGREIDIWATGVLLFYMICGQFPFAGKNFFIFFYFFYLGFREGRTGVGEKSDGL
jgi:serine/threonine-protein kinase HSL1 (negative regulator of Swe1 kinase)